MRLSRPLRSRTLGMLIVRRLLLVPLVLFAVVTIVFFAMRLIPGSPATTLGVAGTEGLSSKQIQENIDALTKTLGLDRPLLEQFGTYLLAVSRLDLGYSFFGSNSVVSLLKNTLPATIELVFTAMIIAVILGVVTGVVAAMRRGKALDSIILAFATVSFSLPWFALGVLGIIVFSVQLGWLPVLGRLPTSLGYQPTTNFVLLDAILQNRPDLVLPWIEHLILPALTLAISMAGFITRMVRASVLEVLGDDFIRTARMKGLDEWHIMSGHVLRNSSLPVVTVLGLQFGSLLGGSVITETVFSYPGVGNLLVSAVNQHDYLLVQGAVFAVALLFILTNVVVDILYYVLDPRLRKA
ncbi:ABC transporter permease [Lacisediminihabitans profunda]|uniref:ABC transporter permease n=2 Tax=Lacisediminihabitans profunda TaxID=2594790 RepID=A0A5C8UPZ8_9MICO|nr:ABC transporter permease [Lacisediminihabitans profunda]